MVIEKNNVVVIKKTDTEHIGFVPISKETYNEIDEATEAYYRGNITVSQFKEKYLYHPLAFILYGETNEVSSSMITRYIDGVDLKEGEKLITSYKCFSGEKWGLDYKQVILHRSALDSWRCLLAFNNNPEYACIVNMNHI